MFLFKKRLNWNYYSISDITCCSFSGKIPESEKWGPACGDHNLVPVIQESLESSSQDAPRGGDPLHDSAPVLLGL